MIESVSLYVCMYTDFSKGTVAICSYIHTTYTLVFTNPVRSLYTRFLLPLPMKIQLVT